MVPLDGDEGRFAGGGGGVSCVQIEFSITPCAAGSHSTSRIQFQAVEDENEFGLSYSSF